MTKQIAKPIGYDSLFDEHPIEIGGFSLQSRAAVPLEGKITITDWQTALQFASGAEAAAPYWVGDLLAYAEDRKDWQDKIEQAKSATKLAQHTLENYTTIARKVRGRARDLAPSPTHARTVAKLPAAEQEHWLEEAATEGYTVSELNKAIRAAERTSVIEGQAALEGMFRVIYADPPWSYNDAGIPSSGALGKASRHYPSMTIADLCALPVASHALEDSVLFLWVTAPMLLTNPGPREVLEAWGFTYKTGAVWDKVLGNWGHYFRVKHEHLLVCTRGSCLPDVPTPMPESVFVERRSDEHSEKPAIARRTIEQLYTRGPYLELFGRKPVEGWSVFGNDARLWADQHAESVSA